MKLPKSFDVVGGIAVLKFRDGESLAVRKRMASALMKAHSKITTVLEKIDKIKGRLRTISVRHLAGVKTTEAVHKENNCSFLLDLEKCYFSPRLSNERKVIAGKIKKGENVLVMFAGVGVFPIIVAKNTKAKRVVAVELGRDCAKYAKHNIKINKVDVEFLQGDVKRVVPKLKEKFDRIVMPRPNLKETFLEQAFMVAKKGGLINYYGFCHLDDVEKLVEGVKEEAKRCKRKIKILNVERAGDIAPYKYRMRIDFKVL